MADIPSPPPGFKIDSSAPPPPPGFKLDSPSAKEDPSTQGIVAAFTSPSGRLVNDKPESMQDTLKQLKTGVTEAGIGGMQVLNELGVSTMPVFMDGKIKLVPVTGKQLANAQKLLQKDEKSGISDWATREAVNPANYIAGPEKLGIGLKSGLQSVVSSLMAPSTDPNKTIGKRVKDAAISAPLGFAVGKGVGAASSAIGAGVPKVVTPSTDSMGALKWIKNFVMDTPKLTVSKDNQSLYNAATKVGLDIKGKNAQQIMEELKDWYSKNISNIATDQSGSKVAGEHHPLASNFAISEMYDAESSKVNALYKNAYDVGDKEKVPAEGIKQSLDSVINDMKGKAPARGLDPKFDRTMDKLESLREEINSGEKPSINQSLGFSPSPPEMVTASWLGKMKRALNEYHVSAPDMTSKDVPYKQLGSKVRQEIEKTSPQFQESLKKADMAYTEKERKFSNKTLEQFWKPEDYDAYKLVKERGGHLNVDTKKRVEKQLDSIKTPADLESLREALPRKYYDEIRGAKFYQIMSKAGLDARAIDKKHDLIVKSLGDDQKSIQLVDAIKTAVEQMNNRGVGNLNPAALTQQDNLFQRSMRTIWSLATGPKLYAIEKALKAANTESAGAVQQRVVNYGRDLKKAAPRTEYTPSAGAKLIAKPLATSVGQTTQ